MSEQAAQTTPVVVVLPAEIDVTNSELVHGQLVATLTPGVGVVIADMTGTTFCDSSGVHAVIFAHEVAAAQGVEMRLAVSAEGSVRRVLQLIGVASVMPVYPSVAAAMGTE
jgi:anti-sigma B factor antagonist